MMISEAQVDQVKIITNRHREKDKLIHSEYREQGLSLNVYSLFGQPPYFCFGVEAGGTCFQKEAILTTI